MPDSCVAPNCTTNSENRKLPKDQRTSVHRFPANLGIRKRWVNAVSITNFVSSQYSALCAKHFRPTDFFTESADSNSTRKKRKDDQGSLVRRKLYEDAIPTIWPGCPESLTKAAPVPRPTVLALSAVREEREQIRNEIRAAIQTRVNDEKEATRASEEQIRDAFKTLEELPIKIGSQLPEHVHLVSETDCVIIFRIDWKNTAEMKFCLKIHRSNEYELWCRGKDVTPIGRTKCKLATTIHTCSQLKNLLDFAMSCEETEPEEKKMTDEEFLTAIHDKLLERFDDNSKISFLAEQLSLVLKKPNA